MVGKAINQYNNSTNNSIFTKVGYEVCIYIFRQTC